MGHDGYKNSIRVEKRYGLIRRHGPTPANLHDSRMLPTLLDAENDAAMVWADAADQSRLVDSMLKTAGYESWIQGHHSHQGSCHHPLNTGVQERNGEPAKTRAKVGHVFGQMGMAMGGNLTRCMG